jgi:hypothetical protein
MSISRMSIRPITSGHPVSRPHGPDVINNTLADVLLRIKDTHHSRKAKPHEQ